jgi:hypothetical protein
VSPRYREGSPTGADSPSGTHPDGAPSLKGGKERPPTGRPPPRAKHARDAVAKTRPPRVVHAPRPGGDGNARRRGPTTRRRKRPNPSGAVARPIRLG